MKLQNLDTWQKDIIDRNGNLVIVTGRQVGKSTVIAIKAAIRACQTPGQSVLIISATERQAEELFIKTLIYVQDNYKAMIKKGKDRPTKRVLKLKNKSIVRCLPTGLSGLGIRGFTINLLIADEAAFMSDDVWQAVTPMLLTTGGDMILISTPFGRRGYFYECYNSDDFYKVHLSSVEVITQRAISESWTSLQRERALEFIEREKVRMPKIQFAQEYLGQFIDDAAQWFPDKLIRAAMQLQPQDPHPEERHIGGVDVGRKKDPSAITFFALKDGFLKQRYCKEFEEVPIPSQVRILKELYNTWKFKRIYIDGNGMGIGVVDGLKEQIPSNKVIDLNTSKLVKKEGRKRIIKKEELYVKTLSMLEQGKLLLLNKEEVFMSMKSVQYHYTDTGTLEIFSKNNHITEAIIRVVEEVRDKSLNIWVRSKLYG